MVRWDDGELLPTYGVILSISDNTATVEFKNITTTEYQVIKKQLVELTKIGSK